MKFEIKNRKDQKLVCVIEENPNSKGLAFVCHGLGGNKDQKHLRTICKAFHECGLSVVSFDTTNTFGESDGKYEDATTTNYLEDLEDVIKYSKKQSWFKSPLYLCGHSLGGITILTYAQRNPQDVKGLVPVSSVVSGELSMQTKKYKDNLQIWKTQGYREEKSESVIGRIKKLKWSHMEDRLKYDILPDCDKIKVPVLIIVGTDDDSTPLEHQKIFFDKLNCDKQLEIIQDAPHTFVDQKHLDQIYDIIIKWITRVEK